VLNAAAHRFTRAARDHVDPDPIAVDVRRAIGRGTLPDRVADLSWFVEMSRVCGPLEAWIKRRLPRWKGKLDYRQAVLVIPALVISGWAALCLTVHLLRKVTPAQAALGPEEAGPYDGAVCIGIFAWLGGFAVALLVQGLIWVWFEGRWDRNLRAHCTDIVRRGLGDLYDDFVSTLPALSEAKSGWTQRPEPTTEQPEPAPERTSERREPASEDSS
jgi:hypothetical protein